MWNVEDYRQTNLWLIRLLCFEEGKKASEAAAFCSDPDAFGSSSRPLAHIQRDKKLGFVFEELAMKKYLAKIVNTIKLVI